MFYLAVRMPGKPQYWLYTRTSKDRLMYAHLHTSALMAEAFKPSDVETIRQMALRVFPGSIVWPIEANTKNIIPANMRKVMNVA